MAESPSLDWVIAPIGRQEFFDSYWERQPLFVKRAQSAYFAPLLSLADVDRVLTTTENRYPDIILKDANNPQLTSSDYTTSSGRIDVARVCELFDQGATIAFSFLDTVLPALTLLCRGLELEFSCPFQTNAYMTPPGAQGAKAHYDTHDVFVLQIAGSKKWTILETPVPLPLQGQSYDENLHHLRAPILEFELEAGDMAYIPRGVGHLAQSTDTVSLHITTGMLRYTWTDFLLEYVAAAGLQEAAFRKSLPPGFARTDFDRTEAKRQARSLLGRLEDPDLFDAVLDSFIDRLFSQCPPVLDGQIEQLRQLSDLTAESVVSPRPGALFRITAADGQCVVHTHGKQIRLPEHAADAVRFALNTPRFTVAEIPGNLDAGGKLTLVRRLIREGLLQAAVNG